MTETSKFHSGFTSAANFVLAAGVSFVTNAAGLFVMSALLGGLGPIFVLGADALLLIYLARGRHYAFTVGFVAGLLAVAVAAVFILLNALSPLRGMG